MKHIRSLVEKGLFSDIPIVNDISSCDAQSVMEQHRLLPEGTRIWKDKQEVIGSCRVFANALPEGSQLNVVLLDQKKLRLPTHPSEQESWHYWQAHIPASISMRIHLKSDGAYNFLAVSADIKTHALYMIEIHLPDGEKRYYSDPMSTFQPFGAYGPSQITDISDFDWQGYGRLNRPAGEMSILELHMATFSPTGTYDGLLTKQGKAWIKSHISDRGFNAVSIMPLVECPGTYNWGYDGSHPFAMHHALGSLTSLCKLIRYFHSQNIAVIMDVQLNHMALQLNPNDGLSDRLSPWPVGPAQHIPMPDGQVVTEYWGGPHWDYTARDASFQVNCDRYWIALQNKALPVCVKIVVALM